MIAVADAGVGRWHGRGVYFTGAIRCWYGVAAHFPVQPVPPRDLRHALLLEYGYVNRVVPDSQLEGFVDGSPGVSMLYP